MKKVNNQYHRNINNYEITMNSYTITNWFNLEAIDKLPEAYTCPRLSGRNRKTESTEY